jgi:hypothetical protein
MAHFLVPLSPAARGRASRPDDPPSDDHHTRQTKCNHVSPRRPPAGTPGGLGSVRAALSPSPGTPGVGLREGSSWHTKDAALMRITTAIPDRNMPHQIAVSIREDGSPTRDVASPPDGSGYELRRGSQGPSANEPDGMKDEPRPSAIRRRFLTSITSSVRSTGAPTNALNLAFACASCNRAYPSAAAAEPMRK